MPFVRCRYYESNGNPITGGCRRLGTGCDFVHPSELEWDRAPSPRKPLDPDHGKSFSAGPSQPPTSFPSRGTRGGGRGGFGRGRGRGRGQSTTEQRNLGGSSRFQDSWGNADNAGASATVNNPAQSTSWTDSTWLSAEDNTVASAWGTGAETDKGDTWGSASNANAWGTTDNGSAWGSTDNANAWGSTDNGSAWGSTDNANTRGSTNNANTRGSTNNANTRGSTDNANTWGNTDNAQTWASSDNVNLWGSTNNGDSGSKTVQGGAWGSGSMDNGSENSRVNTRKSANELDNSGWGTSQDTSGVAPNGGTWGTTSATGWDSSNNDVGWGKPVASGDTIDSGWATSAMPNVRQPEAGWTTQPNSSGPTRDSQLQSFESTTTLPIPQFNASPQPMETATRGFESSDNQDAAQMNMNSITTTSPFDPSMSDNNLSEVTQLLPACLTGGSDTEADHFGPPLPEHKSRSTSVTTDLSLLTGRPIHEVHHQQTRLMDKALREFIKTNILSQEVEDFRTLQHSPSYVKIGASAAQTLNSLRISLSARLQRHRHKYEDLLDRLVNLDESSIRWSRPTSMELPECKPQQSHNQNEKDIYEWVHSFEQCLASLVHNISTQSQTSDFNVSEVDPLLDIITNLTHLETRLKSCGDFFEESQDKPDHALSQACKTVALLHQRLHDIAAALASCTEQFTLLCQNVVKLHDQKVALVNLAHVFKSSQQQALVEHYCLTDQLQESLAKQQKIKSMLDVQVALSTWRHTNQLLKRLIERGGNLHSAVTSDSATSEAQWKGVYLELGEDINRAMQLLTGQYTHELIRRNYGILTAVQSKLVTC